MAKPAPRSAANTSSVSATGSIATISPLSGVTVSDSGSGVFPTTGFTPWDFQDMTYTDPITKKTITLGDDWRESITDITYEKNMMGVTTLTVSGTDPNRTILRTNVKQGTQLTVKNSGTQDLRFAFIQYNKTGDQYQMAFESMTVYRLRQQYNAAGTVTTWNGTDVTSFMASLVAALNYPGSPYGKISFLAPDYATIWSKLTGNANVPIAQVALGRGTSTDPYEDSWTCMQRIASTIGWELWENVDTVYFGPDEFWLGLLTPNAGGVAQPPINVILGTTGTKIPKMQEFGDEIMLMDFDWDVETPYGEMTVTCMLDSWPYEVGEVVQTVNMGMASGYWFVSNMTRDMFMPQGTITLQVPMPYSQQLDPTSLPLPGFPLIAKLTAAESVGTVYAGTTNASITDTLTNAT
jgi:hypothetical protein